MPFTLDDDVISLDGHCPIEEAQPLFEALRAVDEPIFDVSRALSLHTAIVQLMLASAGAVRGAPADLWLAACFRDRVRRGSTARSRIDGGSLRARPDPADAPRV
jgi:hypothetical protein